MRVLIVASYNKGRFAPFIVEQAEALLHQGVEVDYFGVVGKGIAGYLRCLPALKRKIRCTQPNVVHAHFGLSSLLANLQRKVPVVATYHGSDINVTKVFHFSKIAIRLSAYNLFVSRRNVERAAPRHRFALLPCGVNLQCFSLKEKQEARQQLAWHDEGRYKVLFAGAFDNAVKNAALAQEAITLLPQVDLLELKGYTREQTATLFCAVDAFLMTSHTEGSPQVVKEAMACNCPIVSVDVGDVVETIAGVEGCYIAERTAEDVADKVQQALAFSGRTQGRQRILALGLDNETVAKKLMRIYDEVCSSVNTPIGS